MHHLFAFRFRFICTSLSFSQIFHLGCFTELQGQALLSKTNKERMKKSVLSRYTWPFLEQHPKNSYQGVRFFELGMHFVRANAPTGG